MTTYLFIGGHADGQRHDVPADANLHQLVHPVSVSIYDYDPNETVPNTMTALASTTYRRMTWRADDAARYVYVADGVSDLDVLNLLLEGYRRPR